MIRPSNLHFSSLLRSTLSCTLLAVLATSQSNVTHEGRSGGIIPSQGSRPELVTVLDMRNDEDPGDRLLAKSLQGLVNSQVFGGSRSNPQDTDKIYLILNDQDEAWLDWLIEEQYVLSAGEVRNLEELLRRHASRRALLVGDGSIHEAATRAGRQRLLLAANKKVAHKYHLDIDSHGDDDSYFIDEVESLVNEDINTGDEDSYEFAGYRRDVNRDIFVLAPSGDHALDLIDYQIANRVAAFDLKGDSGDAKTIATIKAKYDQNIPCLATEAPTQAVIDDLSKLAKFVIPVDGLSNLSFWTTFRPYQKGISETNSGATRQPRSEYLRSGKDHDNPWKGLDANTMNGKMAWLREVAPPICESWIKGVKRTDYEEKDLPLGIVNGDVYGAAFGLDRERIWIEYMRLSRRGMEYSLGY